ncbi:MAG: DUF362 domain-containing protein [Candidatus Brocadiaceae bacterium]
MKQKESRLSRRQFLRDAAAGALAASALPTIIVPRRAAAFEPGGRIHPNVDPLRVVGMEDAAMVTEQRIPAAWKDQDILTADEAVAENLDRLAMALTEEKNPSDAWKAVFVKPAGKSWSDVVVGVKTNNLGVQAPHSAVMAGVCRVLTDVIGVKGSNIHIYDGITGGDMETKTPWRDLPEGVHLAKQWDFITVPRPVPSPWKDGQQEAKCLGQVAKGNVDILVNVGTCKGHEPQFGGFTLAMKNHFGTFLPSMAHQEGGGLDYLIAINKTAQILGEVGQGGDVLFPRQQLCIVDALWGSDRGPKCPPDSCLNALFMGVCGPVMDYQVAMDFRKGKMGWPVHRGVANRMLAEFGFSPSDLPNGGHILDAAAQPA